MRILACAAVAAALVAGAAFAKEPRLKVALTFDDLPLNGAKPASRTKEEITREAVKVLKKHRIPPSFGFINAQALERSPDGARALEVWIAGGNPLGNHTYSHRSLNRLPLEEFEADVVRGEPVVRELLAAKERSLRYFRHPFLQVGLELGKRRAFERFLAGRGYTVAPVTI